MRMIKRANATPAQSRTQSRALPKGLSRMVPTLLATVLCVMAAAPASTADYKAGAFYFGVFNQGSCDTRPSCDTDWWEGVREYYSGDIDPPWQSDDFSYLLPALGFYDNSQAAVLEKHILQARSNGLEFFNFYWYWKSTLNGGAGGEINEEGLAAFLQAENTEDLEFAVSICAHPWSDLDIPAEHGTPVVHLLINSYLSQPNYLRTSDGRPVVFFIDTRGLKSGSRSDVVDFVSLLRLEVSQHLGVYPFVVISSELGDLDVRTLPAIDGYTCLNYFGLSLADPANDVVGSYSRYNDRLTGVLSQYDNRPMIACFMTDFNEKPRTRLGIPWDQIRYVDDWTLSEYTYGLSQLHQYVTGTNQGVVNNWVTLYAWNEWHEGGLNLEPSSRDGNRQLAYLASRLGLTTSGDSQCRTYGNCTQNTVIPTGTLDLATCTSIAGWARDADSTVPIKVHLYKDAPYGQGGTFVGSYLADRLRTDLPFRDQKHGFSVPTPAAFKTGQTVKVYAYGINVNWNGDADGSNPMLNLSPKTITCSP